MGYAIPRRMRRIPVGTLGNAALGFDWGSFATDIGTSAAQAAASSGVQALKQAIAGTPKPATIVAPAAPTATSASSIPIYVWALGGMGLVLVLVMAMRR